MPEHGLGAECGVGHRHRLGSRRNGLALCVCDRRLRGLLGAEINRVVACTFLRYDMAGNGAHCRAARRVWGGFRGCAKMRRVVGREARLRKHRRMKRCARRRRLELR